MVITIISEPHKCLGTSVLFPKAGKLKWGVFTKDAGRLFESWLHGNLIEGVSSEHSMK